MSQESRPDVTGILPGCHRISARIRREGWPDGAGILKVSEKFAWVVEHGYQYLPKWLKFFLSEEAFRALVQSIFDSIVKLVTEERKRENPIE